MPECFDVSAPSVPLVFSCSGASVAGEAADHAARQLYKSGAARMLCLAGISGRDGSILSAARAASCLLAIDGCPVDCTKRTLEAAGLRTFHHLRATELLGAERDTIPVSTTFERLVREGGMLLKRPSSGPTP